MIKKLVINLTHIVTAWQLFAYSFLNIFRFNYLTAGLCFTIGLLVMSHMIYFWLGGYRNFNLKGYADGGFVKSAPTTPNQ